MNPEIEINDNHILVSVNALNKDGKNVKVTTYLRRYEMDQIDKAISIVRNEIKQYLELEK